MMTPIALSLLSVFALQSPVPPLEYRATPLSDDVLLSISADRQTYYTGERVRLTLSLRNTSDHDVIGLFELDPIYGPEILYKRPGAVKFSVLKCFLRPDDIYYPDRTLRPNSSMERYVDLSVTALKPAEQRFLLDVVGTYQFKVIYEDQPGDPNTALESNVVAVEVVDAPQDERAARALYETDFAYLAQIAKGSDGFVTREELAAAASFLERFPDSRYAGPMREGLLVYLGYRVRTKRATEDERAVYEKLTRNADTTAPQLQVQAAPSRLWPPNHTLVPVTVTLSVQDDEDSNPVVELESITCDDGCDASGDVAGAVYGMDDREFELRAERSGKGSGRTYTITYSAKDAAGNTTKRAATVVVPQDQGKGK